MTLLTHSLFMSASRLSYPGGIPRNYKQDND